MIASDENVAGIDAREIHIITIHMLKDLKEHLNNLETKLEDL